jgi:hypothetical protein
VKRGVGWLLPPGISGKRFPNAGLEIQTPNDVRQRRIDHKKAVLSVLKKVSSSGKFNKNLFRNAFFQYDFSFDKEQRHPKLKTK